MARWLEDVWLSRYLDHELNDDEHAWFETYMLDKQHLLEQVDADTRLRDGLRSSAKSSASIAATTADPTSQPANARARGPWLGIAASLLIGLGLGASLMQLRSDNSMLVASPPRIVFDTMRGVDDTIRGGSTSTQVEPGSVESKLLIVDIAVPFSGRVLSASAWIDGKQTRLPTPVISSEGFVTYVVPADWQHRARIELEMQLGDLPKTGKVSFQL